MKTKYYNNTLRVNICTLFANIPIYIYLIPVPILQNILFSPQKTAEYITSYILSLLIFVIVGGYAAANYLVKRYSLRQDGTYICTGFPFNIKTLIPYEKLHSVTIQSSPLTEIFSAVKIQLNTPAVRVKKSDVIFYLSKNKAQTLVSEIYSDIGAVVKQYRAKNLKIFFMASVWSNPVSGILIIAPFIRNFGKVMGEQLQIQFFESFDFSAYLMYIGLPPVTAFAAYFLLLCYFVSVAADFIRHSGFTCTSYKNGILIQRGIIKRTLFLTNKTKINSLTISQSLVMLPVHLYSAYIYTIGSGKAKGDKSLLVAAERKSVIKELLPYFLSDGDKDFSLTAKPVKKALKSYVMLPFVLLFLDAGLLIALQYIEFPTDLILTLMIFTVPFLAIWCVFRFIAFGKSSVSCNSEVLLVRSYLRWTFNSTIIPKNKIQLCVMHQNLFQRRLDTCNLRIYIYGESRSFVQVKHLSRVQAERVISEIFSLQRRE